MTTAPEASTQYANVPCHDYSHFFASIGGDLGGVSLWIVLVGWMLYRRHRRRASMLPDPELFLVTPRLSLPSADGVLGRWYRSLPVIKLGYQL